MSRTELIVLVGEQARQICALTAMNEDLVAKLAKLEHLLSRNSGNSSMPPCAVPKLATSATCGFGDST
jgi:hypothetical protein